LRREHRQALLDQVKSKETTRKDVLHAKIKDDRLFEGNGDSTLDKKSAPSKEYLMQFRDQNKQVYIYILNYKF